jgi:hypothetical protein
MRLAVVVKIPPLIALDRAAVLVETFANIESPVIVLHPDPAITGRMDANALLVSGQRRNRVRHGLEQRAHREQRYAVVLDVGVVDDEP